MGAQMNRLIETVLLSTHNICFGWEIRKFINALLFWGMFFLYLYDSISCSTHLNSLYEMSNEYTRYNVFIMK